MINCLYHNSKGIIFLLFFSVIFISINSKAQVNKKKEYKAINLFDFKDSAHHWRDITDADKIITPLSNQKRYKLNQITEIADNILLFQCNNGGWRKNYDMAAILTKTQKEKLLKAKADTETTFDNGTTYSQVEYLAKVWQQTKNNKYMKASLRGIKFMLKAQYPNGGWPQFYPDTSGYRKFITYNDGAMIGIMKVFHEIIENKSFFSFVDNSLREKVVTAFNKGIECILKTQIRENGKLTAWCQQHDNIDFRPQHARTFELPSVCGEESVGIVLFLMSLENPSNAVIKSVQSAVRWFNKSKIYGLKIKRIKAPKVVYKYRTSTTDKIVVKDPNAPPIWARFYELKTNRPLFSDRNSIPVYSLNKLGRERRDGYTWYTYAPDSIFKVYPKWQKKFAQNKNAVKE